MATSHYFIGGGAEHTAEMVRRDSYAKIGGAEGVCGVADLLVLPLEVPGGAVRTTIGSGYMRSFYAGAVNETYMGSVVTQEITPIPPNVDAENPRHDLIVMRVQDPYVQGSPWPDPAAGVENPEEAEEIRSGAQYVFIERIPSVPEGTRNLRDVPGYETDTGLALTRIDLPPSTGTVTTEHLVDLRVVAQPRRTEVVFARPRVGGDSGPQMYLGATMEQGGELFPGGAGIPNRFEVDIPEWATRMVIDADWMCIYYAGSQNPFGRYWIEYGDEWRGDKSWPNMRQLEFQTQAFGFNAPGISDVSSDGWSLMDEQPIPAKLRGKRVWIAFKAGRSNGNATAVFMNAMGGLGCRITFAERAIDSDLL